MKCLRNDDGSTTPTCSGARLEASNTIMAQICADASGGAYWRIRVNQCAVSASRRIFADAEILRNIKCALPASCLEPIPLALAVNEAGTVRWNWA